MAYRYMVEQFRFRTFRDGFNWLEVRLSNNYQWINYINDQISLITLKQTQNIILKARFKYQL